MTLVLNNQEIESLLAPELCLEALEEAYRELGNGHAVNRMRTHTYLPPARRESAYCFKSMEGGIASLEVMALRLTSDRLEEYQYQGLLRRDKIPAAPGNKFVGLILLFSTRTCEPLAIMPDGFIQKMRVGATSALGAKYLARPEAQVLGLFGSGWQASAHVLALAKVRPLKEIRVYSPTPEHRERFAEVMAPQAGVEIRPVDNPKEAVVGCDLVVTATNSSVPVFDGTWLEEGTHLTSIVGGDQIQKRSEVDQEAFRRSGLLVVNAREQVRAIGQEDVLRAIEAGYVTWDRIYELAEVVVGKAPARADPRQITFFKNNVGLGIQFAAVGLRVYQLARERGVGREVPTDWFLQTENP